MTMAWTKGLALGLLVGATGCIVSIGDDDDDRGGRGGSLGVAGRGGTGGTGGSSAGTGGSGGDASGGNYLWLHGICTQRRLCEPQRC